jgi:DEAD/DEAH box helicase domain-containing protein
MKPTHFKGLVNTGLVSCRNFPLHSHQAEMLKQALLGKNCIITSGTGSGKTESFLLPLVCTTFKRTYKLAAPHANPATVNTWWKVRADGGLPATQIVNTSNFTLE